MERKITPPFRISTLFSYFNNHWDETFSFPGEDHEQYEVVYVLEGGVEVTEDERIYRLNEGQMVIHAPYEFHRIRSLKGTHPWVIVFSFRAEGEVPERLTDGILCPDEREKEKLKELILPAEDFLHGTSPDIVGAWLGAELTAFLWRTYRGAEILQEESHDFSAAARQYRAVVTAMQDAVCENLTLSDIAERVHISVSYLKDLFTEYAGIPPAEYYRKLRCNAATVRLRAGMSVGDVAEELHFSSCAYFSSFFKRTIGVTPLSMKASDRQR